MPINHETDEENVIRRAALAVGENEGVTLHFPPLDDQIRDLSPEAGPLARILDSISVRAVHAELAQLDRAAVRLRASYDRTVLTIILFCAIAIYAGLSAILTPAPILGASQQSSEWLTTLLVYACLLVSLILAHRLGKARTYEKWSETRGAAEYLRRELFDEVLACKETSGPRELPILPLKLEHFRRYQLDVQETYHAVRARQYERAVRWARWCIVPCFVMVGIWLLALAAEVLSASAEQAPLPGFVPDFVFDVLARMQWLGTTYADIYWLLFGVLTTAIYGVLFLLTTLNSSLRNAARFAHAKENFAYLRRTGLASARQAAARGDEAGVLRYVHRVHSVMSSELSDWVRLMDLDRGKEDAARAEAAAATGTN